MFARLTSGEAIPAEEKMRLPSGQYSAGPRVFRRHRREPSPRRSLAMERARHAFRSARVTLCVLAVVAGLIAFTLISNQGRHEGCRQARFTVCATQVPAPTARPQPPGTGG